MPNFLTHYEVKVHQLGYKPMVPYNGYNLMIALAIAKAYIARGENVEFAEVTGEANKGVSK